MFTNEIWGDSVGHRFIFTGKPRSAGKAKRTFTDNTEAYEYAIKQAQAGLEVWYAVAIFNEPTKKEIANVKELRALWLDLDIDANNPDKYSTQAEALHALQGFVKDNRLPWPTVISSGGGLHTYFLFTDAVARLEWQKLANALKKLVKAYGLKADNQVTGDSSRLLRLPGTFNLKQENNPRPVTPLTPLVKTDFDSMGRALAQYVTDEKVKVVNDAFAVDIPTLPADAGKIAEACAQMRHVRDTRGNVQEPLWYGALGILAHCTNGEALAHEYSNGYPKYNAKETQEKFERSKEYGPTLCETFSDRNPAQCNGCPYAGKIKTPLVLGHTVTALTPPTQPAPASAPIVQPITTGVVVQPANSYPAPPNGYQVGKEGVYRLDTETGQSIKVCPLPIFVLAHRESKEGVELELIWQTHLGAEKRAGLPMSALGDKKELSKWLYRHGIAGFRSPDEMKAYIEAGQISLAKQTETTRQYDRYGWDDGNFILGSAIITPSGIAPVDAPISARVPKKIITGFKAIGNAEEWANATHALKRPGLWVHRFTIFAILGTPLVKLANWSGAMISLAGDSGVGKTTACNFGTAAYSNHRAAEITTQSTDRAIYERMYLVNNLAVVINESSTLQPYRVSNFVYAAVEGHARDTLTQNSTIRDTEPWANITVLTSNIHLYGLSDKFLNEANRYRTLEFSLDKNENLILPDEAAIIYETIEKNYGFAGQKFLSFVVANRKAVRAALDQSYKRISNQMPPQCRFMAWAICVADVAGMICAKLGLVYCPVEDAITGAVATAQKLAKTINTESQRVEDIVGNYINAHQSYFTRLDNGNWTNVEIRGEVVGRYTSDATGETLAINWASLVEYAREAGVDKQNLTKWAEVKGAQIGANIKLAKGSFATRCLVMQSPEKQGGSV